MKTFEDRAAEIADRFRDVKTAATKTPDTWSERAISTACIKYVRALENMSRSLKRKK